MKCGICGHSPLSELLVYGNMPNVAQNLPDDDALRSDRGVDLRICQCGFCGTVQLDNAPVPYYREVIRATWVSEEMRRFRSSQFSDFINRFGLHGKKIIEIGCGSGENLRILKESGAEPYGLEYSEKSVLTAKSMGLSVYQGFVDSSGYKIGDTLFDGFYTFSYLEHLPNPAETLKGVYNNLSDGAYGIVEVPNMDMFVKEGVFYEFMLDHLFYFTKDTLCTLLRLSGFDVLSCGTVWHDYIISAVVKKNKTLDLSYMEELRAGIIPLTGRLYLQPAEQRPRILATVGLRRILKETLEHSLIQRLPEPARAGAEGNGRFAIQKILYEQRLINIVITVLNHTVEEGLAYRQRLFSYVYAHNSAPNTAECDQSAR